jgi:peptide/nickel transport system ATP-binding protein
MAGSGMAHMRGGADVVLEARNMVVEFKAGGGRKVHAVSNVSFDVLRGETLAIVGESGCGKTTLGKAVLQVPPPTSGDVVFEGRSLTSLGKEELRAARTAIQMIFQDPISSLDPRMTVKDLVEEPLWIWRRGDEAARAARVDELLENVGLDPALVLDRRSWEFSGGQCQRISIARSLALEPRMLICDEPVSALDVSIQAQILNLLQDMKDRFGLTMIFISHDLAVVKAVSNRIMVMYLGKVCEVGTPDAIYARPAHHYTRRRSSTPCPCPTPTAPVRPSRSRASLRHRSRRLRAAASARDAPRRRSSARSRSRSCARSPPVSSSPATIRAADAARGATRPTSRRPRSRP